MLPVAFRGAEHLQQEHTQRLSVDQLIDNEDTAAEFRGPVRRPRRVATPRQRGVGRAAVESVRQDHAPETPNDYLQGVVLETGRRELANEAAVAGPRGGSSVTKEPD